MYKQEGSRLAWPRAAISALAGAAATCLLAFTTGFAEEPIDGLRPGGLGEDCVRRWYEHLDSRWEPLVGKAGRPQGGLVLVARWSEFSTATHPLRELLVSVRNVGNGSVTIARTYSELPLVIVRNGAGKMVALSGEGAKAYGLRGESVNFVELKPGHGYGTAVRLDRYLNLATPGVYAVLATQPPSGNDGPLVAKPLVLDLRRAATYGGSKGVVQRVPVDAPGPLIRSASPADKEWHDLAAKVGVAAEGCVLESLVSPVLKEKPNLIVSLRCDALLSGARDYLPRCGSRATDYRVLVRDRRGNPVAPIRSAGRAPPGPEASKHTEIRYLRIGDAIGARIPLAEWFDLAKPGEYSVLVSLTTPGASGPTWVANPIEVRVGK